jgi:diguanylate cyclase (GGDEF)-like protein
MTDTALQPNGLLDTLRRLPGLGALGHALQERSLGAGWRALFERRHAPALEKARAQTLSTRVRWFAGALALLTVALVMTDLLIFTRVLPAWLACGQVVAALPFVMLALPPQVPPTMPAARVELCALLGLPLMYFLFATLVLPSLVVDEAHQQAIILMVYSQGLFVLAAGLSLFPLTALEAGIALAAVLVVAGLDDNLREGWTSVTDTVGRIWLLLLVGSIAAIAAMSQLTLLAMVIDRSARDHLTGLLTREFGVELLEAQFRVAERHDQPLSMLFLDIDRFRSINDRYGHEAGDRILQKMAAALAVNFRTQDILIRWGGEEFLVLMPNTDEVGARKALARLAKQGVGVRPDGAPLTCCAGLAERSTDSALDWTKLLECADERMYAAKDAGRNAWIDSRDLPAALFPLKKPAEPEPVMLEAADEPEPVLAAVSETRAA